MRLSAIGRISALAISTAGLTHTSNAQQAEPMQKVEISGSAASYDPRRDDTASKIVVPQEDLARYGDATLADALKRVPGITVRSTGRGSDVQMRGLGAGYTQILLNGQPAPWGFSIDSLSPTQVERIEVLRSASAEFSTESVAGTINIVLKKTVRTAQRTLELNAGADRIDQTRRAMLQWAGKHADFSYAVSFYLRHSGTERLLTFDERSWTPGSTLYSQRSSESQLDANFNFMNLVSRLQWTLPGGDTLVWETLANGMHFGTRADQHTVALLGGQPRIAHNDRHGRVNNRLLKTDLEWTRKLPGSAKLELKLGGQRGSAQNDSRRYGFAADGGALLDSTVNVAARSRGWSGSGKLAAPFADNHAIRAGWETSGLARDDERRQHDAPLAGSALFDSAESFAARNSRLAFFAQDEWTINPKWSVYLGARREALRTTVDGSSNHAAVWSPIVQTLYKLRPEAGDQLRVALARTFKAPQHDELVPRRTLYETNTSTNPDTQGNPRLRPELAMGFDASYEYYWGKDAMLSASVSARRIRDYINSRVQLGADGRWLATPFNNGAASTRSVELEARVPLSPRLKVRAAAGRHWSEVAAVPVPDNRIAQQVPLSATFSADYAIGTHSVGANYVQTHGGWSRRSVRESAYTAIRRELDVYALWRPGSGQQVRFFVGNLLRSGKQQTTGYEDETGRTHYASFEPAYVTARLTLELKF
jgi:outer membrane receptor for ferrienterochelin and colicins